LRVVHGNCENVVEGSQIDFAEAIGHQVDTLASKSGMSQSSIYFSVRTWFTVLAETVDFVLFALNSAQMEVPGDTVTLVGLDIKPAGRVKVLHLFGCVVQSLGGELDFNGLEVGRDLEVDYKFAVVGNLEVVEGLGDRNVVDVVDCVDGSLCVLELGQGGLAAIYEQLRLNNNLCAVSYKNLLAVQEERTVKGIFFALPREFAHLRESAMLHNNFISNLVVCVGNKNGAFLLVCLVELLLKKDACLIVLGIAALADLLLVVQDVEKMTSHS